MLLNREKIHNRVPVGWSIVWEGEESVGGVVKHTIIKHDKTGIEMFLWVLDLPVYDVTYKQHPITGKTL